ncbi:OmpA family protein [Thermodesulfobacteriota bacterium]
MKKILIRIGLLATAITLIASSAAIAGVRKGSLHIEPFIGGYHFESDQKIDDISGEFHDPRAFNYDVLGVRLGYNITKRFGLEGSYERINTSFKPFNSGENGTIPVDLSLFRLDGYYHLLTGTFAPFLVVGGGMGLFEMNGPGDSKKEKALANYGLGLKVFATEDLGIRADVRHVIPFDDIYHNLEFNVGVFYAFGGKPPKDTDGDGIFDKLDDCPNTPLGAQVNGNGCPLDEDGDGVFNGLDNCPDTRPELQVDEFGCPLDSDGDGVYDGLDNCPGTPSEVPVDNQGCPSAPDSDGDGVPDELDLCPATPAGTEVADNGCPELKGREIIGIEEIRKAVALLKVKFQFDDANLKADFYALLDQIREMLQSNEDVSICIEGHASLEGDEQYNQLLSEKRALTVKQYLVDQGIDTERLVCKGYGETKPIAPNDTPQGRVENRRVEFKVLEE